MKLVVVDWLDANRSDGWHPRGDMPHVEACQTVGWLLKEDTIEVVLAGTVASDGQIGEAIAIPKGMVQKMEFLSGDHA